MGGGSADCSMPVLVRQEEDRRYARDGAVGQEQRWHCTEAMAVWVGRDVAAT